MAWWDMVMRCLSIDKRSQYIDKLHLALEEHLPHIYRRSFGNWGMWQGMGGRRREWEGMGGAGGNGEIQMAFGQLASGKWQMANGLHNCRLTDHFSPSTPTAHSYLSVPNDANDDAMPPRTHTHTQPTPLHRSLSRERERESDVGDGVG